jgi:hypothetical protein
MHPQVAHRTQQGVIVTKSWPSHISLIFYIIPIFLLVFALRSWQRCCCNLKGMAPYLVKLEIKIQVCALEKCSKRIDRLVKP